MKKENKYNLSIFVFRRDLRLDDNTGLLSALSNSEEVMPVFFFDPRQTNPKSNRYFSKNAFFFMINSLEELNKDISSKGGKLFFFYGKPEKILKQLIKEYNIEAVFFNRDYTPFSKMRDLAISKLCNKMKIDVNIFGDALLHEPEIILKTNGTPYTVFTHYMNAAKKIPVPTPVINFYTNYMKSSNLNIKEKCKLPVNNIKKYEKINNAVLKGGRSGGLKIISNIERFEDYKKLRDFPALDATTHLSAHLKFGTVSIREVYHAISSKFGPDHSLIRSLYWRDFFTYIAYHFPIVFQSAFNKKYRSVKWSNNIKFFNAWKRGKTGFPFIDAGMRELLQTGFIHNRVRMAVASFLTKDLRIDWRLGEKHFAKNLIDYDPCVNNGNWQWVASVGCDAQPYFRVFNPWLQQKKFDPKCIYIKKWVKELVNLNAEEIHSLYKITPPRGYPKPIVDHKKEILITKMLFNQQIK